MYFCIFFLNIPYLFSFFKFVSTKREILNFPNDIFTSFQTLNYPIGHLVIEPLKLFLLLMISATFNKIFHEGQISFTDNEKKFLFLKENQCQRLIVKKIIATCEGKLNFSLFFKIRFTASFKNIFEMFI